MSTKWRDRLATAIITATLKRVASRGYRDRFVRTLRTGDPEARVPVEEVVLGDASRSGGTR